MKGRPERSALGLLAVLLLVVAPLAGCSGGTGTSSAEPSSAQPRATSTATPQTPTPIPTPDPLAAGIGLIQRLGGTAALEDGWQIDTYGSGADPSCESIGIALPEGGWCAWNSAWNIAWREDGTVFHIYDVADAYAEVPRGNYLTDAEAKARVLEVAQILDASLGAPDRVAFEQTVPGWMATWVRKIAGDPAPGDGIQIVLTPDGAFLEYELWWSPAGPVPASTITRAEIVAKFPQCARSGKCALTLMWVKVGDSPTLQLVWQVVFLPGGCTGVWLDAETGEEVQAMACA